jgi:hypothetical protein
LAYTRECAETGEDLLGETQGDAELDAGPSGVGFVDGLDEVRLTALAPAGQVLETVFMEGVE